MIKLVEEKKEQRKQLNNRLKPCPFCGGKAQIEVNQTDIVIIL